MPLMTELSKERLEKIRAQTKKARQKLPPSGGLTKHFSIWAAGWGTALCDNSDDLLAALETALEQAAARTAEAIRLREELVTLRKQLFEEAQLTFRLSKRISNLERERDAYARICGQED